MIVFIPTDACEPFKQALFAAGGGRIGSYDCCSWQIDGWGQFRPLSGARPSLGQIGQIERVAETRLELAVSDQHRAAVQQALERAHPYQTPAYFWVAVDNLPPSTSTPEP